MSPGLQSDGVEVRLVEVVRQTPMHFLPLLGQALKSDAVIEYLELRDIPVIYHFDRLHEGGPDIYWASSGEEGVQMRFNENQILSTIFLHVVPTGKFAAFNQGDSDIRYFNSPAEVRVFGETQRLKIKAGQANYFGIASDWVLLGFGRYSIHYEFQSGTLAMITLSTE